MPITRAPFGTLPDGSLVECFTLERENLRAQVIPYGASLISIQIPDHKGMLGEITLGHDTLEGYLKENPYFGAVVGRYANRIAGAQFTLDGKTYRLTANRDANHLHGGSNGFGRRMWHPEILPDGERLALSLLSPDGDEGYPGNLIATVVYSLLPPLRLRMEYLAVTDKPTIVNLTNHAYFNLRGEGAVLGHRMQMACDVYLPVREDLVPTGVLQSVAGTPFDFRRSKPIGADIESPDTQIRVAGGYDHTFVVRGTPGKFRRACRVSEPHTRRWMEVWTTEPGFQFYTMNIQHTIAGRQRYSRWSGFCVETHHFPDSPNQPHFPSTVVRPGEVYRSLTELRFGVG